MLCTDFHSHRLISSFTRAFETSCLNIASFKIVFWVNLTYFNNHEAFQNHFQAVSSSLWWWKIGFSQENTANDRRGIETYKSSRHLVKLASSQIGTYLTSIRHPIIFVIIFSIQLINNCYQVHSEYVVVYKGKQRSPYPSCCFNN